MRVVVVGGGVMGSSFAWWLSGDPAFTGEILVVERDSGYRRASSALSASSVRQQFSTPVNIAIGRFGFDFLRRAEDLLAVGGERPAIGLVERGYLMLAGAESASILRANHALQREYGVEVALLDPDALRARFPWLATEGLALGSLGLSGEGWFDGWGLLQAFRRAARARGARYLEAEVVAGERRGRRALAVRLASGERLAADVLVVAAGPWAARVAAMFELALPVEARRRCGYMFETPEPPAEAPLVVDPSGVWFRPEGRGFICGAPPPEEEDLPDLPLVAEDGFFEERIWPALAERVPAFERLRLRSSWAGYYAYNRFDQNALLGAHPEVDNLFFMAGFSGHGIQQAPAVGRGIAELVLHGAYRSLDLSPLDIGRLAAGRPLRERAVI